MKTTLPRHSLSYLAMLAGLTYLSREEKDNAAKIFQEYGITTPIIDVEFEQHFQPMTSAEKIRNILKTEVAIEGKTLPKPPKLRLESLEFQKRFHSMPKQEVVKDINFTEMEIGAQKKRICTYADISFIAQQRLIAIIWDEYCNFVSSLDNNYDVLKMYEQFIREKTPDIHELYFLGLFKLYGIDNYSGAISCFQKISYHSGAAFELALLYYKASHQKRNCLWLQRDINYAYLKAANAYCSVAIFNRTPNPSALALKALIYSAHPHIKEPKWAVSAMHRLKEIPLSAWFQYALSSSSVFATEIYRSYTAKCSSSATKIPHSNFYYAFEHFGSLFCEIHKPFNVMAGFDNAHVHPSHKQLCADRLLRYEKVSTV